MTIKQKRKTLKKYKIAEDEIERLCELRIKWICKAEKITTSYSFNCSRTNTNPSKIEKAYEKIEQVEESISIKIEKQIEIQKYLEECIDKLENEKYKTILKYKYINLYTFEKIAEKLGYWNARYVRQLEVKALNKLSL